MSGQRDMFEPNEDAKGAQCRMVLAHLERGEGLTATEALGAFGIGRLAAVVHTLRKAGHSIKTEPLSVEKAHGRGRATVGRYWLARYAPPGAR